MKISSGFGRSVRELHGRELLRWYADQDARKAFLKRLVDKAIADGRKRAIGL